jgi:hypothetical protein
MSMAPRAALAQAPPTIAPANPAPPPQQQQQPQLAQPQPQPQPTPPLPPQVPPPPEEFSKAIYLWADIGFTRSHVGVVESDLGLDKTAANGVLYGVAGGLRLRQLLFGLRWQLHDTTEFSLWTISATVGYELAMRPITPVISGHLGYVFDQEVQAGAFRSSLPEGNVLPPNVDLQGALLGVDVSAGYRLNEVIRVGAFLGADLMYLVRPKVGPPQSLFGPTPELDSNPLYSTTGHSMGLNLSAGFRGVFDVGFR